MSFRDPYTYPGTAILQNRLGIAHAAELGRVERQLVTQRIVEGAPTGNFDLPHLRAIHHHLFQDIYAWAGELRTVEITKQGNQFQFLRSIETGMADIHRRLSAEDFLRGLDHLAFAEAAGQIIGDVHYVHPFRDGNGRTQLLYLKQLADQAGHELDLARLEPARWVAASRAAHNADYAPMTAEITQAILDERSGRRVDAVHHRSGTL